MQLLRIVYKLLQFFFDLMVIYFLFAIVGLFWTRSNDEAITRSGIPIVIHGDGFHTELYLPVLDSILHHDWLDFLKDSAISRKHRHNKYFNVGWAEEDWSIAGARSNSSVWMAFETLFWPWNKSIMHVQLMDTFHILKHPFTEHRLLTPEHYQKLIDFIVEGFVIENNVPVIRSYNGYYGFDYFFASRRNYNAFNTCNQWTADGLNACNIRNPIFAPFGWSIAYTLKRSFRAEPVSK